MKKETITGEFKRQKRRAIELYHQDSPFKPHSEKNKKAFKRKPKHSNKVFEDL